MSNYGDQFKAEEQAAFLERWTPRCEAMPAPTAANIRWNVARARAAEHELKALKDALRTLKGALK